MKFIVSVYKGILVLWLGVVVVAASFAASTAMLNGASGRFFQGWSFLYVLLGLIAAVLSVGLAATIISIHDRVVEVRSDIGRLAGAIEQQKSDAPHS